jgi:hypothetical protein
MQQLFCQKQPCGVKTKSGNLPGINNITNRQWQTKGEIQAREFSPDGPGNARQELGNQSWNQ